ncbi:hypothetical protein [Burkholderia pseudomallei]|uniref:hypothetical protein n=1 Tax=Burkholderia pseudomallei TaxID=28450 RepID=UPI0009B25391|nr:hypothetical protein [Burkholderia pseudomallei]
MSAALPAEVKAGGRRAAGRTASRIVCMTTEDEFRRNEKIVAQQQANENARHPEPDCRAFFIEYPTVRTPVGISRQNFEISV